MNKLVKRTLLLLAFFISYMLFVYFFLMGGEVGGFWLKLPPLLAALELIIFPISSRNPIAWFFGGFIMEGLWTLVLTLLTLKIVRKSAPNEKRLLYGLILSILVAISGSLISHRDIYRFKIDNPSDCQSLVLKWFNVIERDNCILGFVTERLNNILSGETALDHVDLTKERKSHKEAAVELLHICSQVKDERARNECHETTVNGLMRDRYNITRINIMRATNNPAFEVADAPQAVTPVGDPLESFEYFKYLCLNMKDKGEKFVSCMKNTLYGHLDVQKEHFYNWCDDVVIPLDSEYYKMPDPNIWKKHCKTDLEQSFVFMEPVNLDNNIVYVDIPKPYFDVYGFGWIE